MVTLIRKIINKSFQYLYLTKVTLKIKFGLLENPRGVIFIDKGLYSLKVFNTAYVKNILSLFIYYLDKGYIPLMIDNCTKSGLCWTTFFKNPIGDNNSYANKPLMDILDNKGYRNSYKGILNYYHDIPYRYIQRKFWSYIVCKYLKLNNETEAYIRNEYISLFKDNMKVLGVCCRGTDYEKLKPAYHPVQPNLEDVAHCAQLLIEKYSYTHIYLATEDKDINDYFEKQFPHRIIINKRHYLGEIFKEQNLDWCHQVILGIDNEPYVKGIEYLSSIYLLSKCDGLIGGNCGASQLALLLNNFKYKNVNIFKLGLYPPNPCNKVGTE